MTGVPFTLPGPGQAACPCSVTATHRVEWECARGHPGRAALCAEHAAIHVAALLSEGIMCAACRREGTERVARLLRVNGKKVTQPARRAT